MALFDGLRQKVRLSLVVRLNWHTLVRLFTIFLTVNILLAALFALAITVRFENEAGRTVAEIRDGSLSLEEKDLPVLLENSDGLTVNLSTYRENWKNFTQMSPGFMKILETARLDGIILSPQATRNLSSKPRVAERTFSEWLNSLVYRLSYPSEASSDGMFVREILVFEAPVLPQVLFYGFILLVVMVFEFFLFLGSIPAGSRSARRILRPIDEMAKITRNINANRLDTRLNLGGSQNELKDLAETINHMLERIHVAYRSQIRFVSDASHELRTPIAVIQGYANLLDRWGKDDPQALQESIDALKAESENMKEMVEKLLFLARGDNQTLTLHKEPVLVDHLLNELLRETTMIDPHHVYHVKKMAHAAVFADVQLLKQAIRILIDNSMKYTPAGKEITLSCSVDGQNRVRISVQDSGMGIAPDDIPHIFDRFYRADESRDRKTGGTGLGLSIAQWIVERHDGTIDVLSRQDLGTRISILLPRMNHAESSDGPVKPA